MKSIKKSLEVEEKTINEEFQRLEQIRQNLLQQANDILTQQLRLNGRLQEVEKLKEQFGD